LSTKGRHAQGTESGNAHHESIEAQLLIRRAFTDVFPASALIGVERLEGSARTHLLLGVTALKLAPVLIQFFLQR
jgi:hypothetical protein